MAAIGATSIVTDRKPGGSVVAPTAETAMVAIPAINALANGTLRPFAARDVFMITAIPDRIRAQSWFGS